MNSFDASAQKAKLDALRSKFNRPTQSANSTEKALFKSKLNEPQIIRIVPMPDGDIPMQELRFYYNTGYKQRINDRDYNVSILSPTSYGESDPIEMFAEMFTSENSDEYANLNQEIKNKILKQIRPSTKYFVPVIVRGQEAQGVKYWGVTEKLLASLLDNIEKEGHLIYDPINGRDLKVWQEDMGTYRQTKFELGMVKPLAEDELSRNAFITNHPNLIDQFNKKSFTELKEVINQVLAPYTNDIEQKEETEAPIKDYNSVHQAAPVVEEPVQEQVAQQEEDPFSDLPF